MTSLEPTTSWGSQRHQSLTKEQRSPWAPCLKMTSWGHPSPQKHPPGMMGPPGTLAPSELSCQAVLDQLRQEFPRFPPHLAAQVESVNLTLQKIRQGLQEHHKQMESFLRTVETWSQALGFQPAEASPEASLHPEAETPQPSGLQGPPFEDVLAARSSDWLRQPSRAGTGPPMPDTQSPWDPEPRFWQDVLTEQLWQIFMGTHKRDQRRRIPATERLPGLESQDAGPQDSGLEPRSGDALVPSPPEPSPSSPEGSREESSEPGLPGLDTDGMLSRRVAQAPAGRAYRFLKPICWDPEDFEDTWKRPDALPWQSQKAAIPRRAEKMRTLKHGEPVLATAVSSCTRHAFTCGRGGVKVWSLVGGGLEDRHPESYLRVQVGEGLALGQSSWEPGESQPPQRTVTCPRATPDPPGLPVHLPAVPDQHDPADGRPQPGRRECVGPDRALPACERRAALRRPHLPGPGLRPRGHPGLRGLHRWHSQGLGLAGPEHCQGPARAPKWNQEHCCQRPEYLDGGAGHLPAVLGPEDPRGAPGIPIRVSGREDQPTLQMSRLRPRGVKLLVRARKPGSRPEIMSLSPSPHEDWVLVGTASGQQWLQPARGGQKHMVGCKDSTILGLKFSPSGQWWVSVGTDDLVSIYGMPGGIVVFQVPETSSILCCDVSPNNRLVVTGSEDHASVYQITY
ncbi:transducin-like enhancer protein 6 isoform X1 [Mustela putorius furo]|uniref:Transducin-like enhancer protein 6 isoform X1 n=3 Tax=Mustela putorius furo TaxID=9669 RepID=A0A8U0NJ39_MUSPF|nr:transducin-like enhancer protein 6 isoform X1 [Mustela putorius furo]